MFGIEARASVAQAAGDVKGDVGLAVWTVAHDSDAMNRETSGHDCRHDIGCRMATRVEFKSELE